MSIIVPAVFLLFFLLVSEFQWEKVREKLRIETIGVKELKMATSATSLVFAIFLMLLFLLPNDIERVKSVKNFTSFLELEIYPQFVYLGVTFSFLAFFGCYIKLLKTLEKEEKMKKSKNKGD